MGALQIAGVILSDFRGLCRVCGPAVGLRWLAKVAGHFGECRREMNLQPADKAMGPGPFPARFGRARARIVGDQSISGIREIWVRGVYLGGGFVEIKDGDVVVDLGANKGNFTMQALGHGPNVRVVAVEPNSEENERFRKQLEENGWVGRAQLVRAFIGGDTEEQAKLREFPEFQGVQTLSEREFIERTGLERIDYLKCDIEGSEFELLTPQSEILRMTRQLGIELHASAGDIEGFVRMLEGQGFEVYRRKTDPGGLILQARRSGASGKR